MISFKNILGFISFSIISCFSLFAAEQKTPIVAVTQIAPHPSLDAIRQGLEETIHAKLPEARVSFENAQGNMTMAVQIASRFVSQSPDIVVTITTPSTQAALKTTRAKGIPLVFVAVSDPGAIGLPLAGESSAELTGVADLPPLEDQVALIKKLTPDVKKVGFIYNPGEANSIAVLEKLSSLMEKNAMTLYPVTASSTNEISTAASSLAGQVDAIFISNDNTVVSALNAVLKVAQAEQIPIYASDPESVERGCLAAVAPSQYDIGAQAGELVVRVLAGESLEKIPVEVAKSSVTTVNSTVAKQLGVVLPSDLSITKGA